MIIAPAVPSVLPLRRFIDGVRTLRETANARATMQRRRRWTSPGKRGKAARSVYKGAKFSRRGPNALTARLRSFRHKSRVLNLNEPPVHRKPAGEFVK